jgi:hypothetical protein
MSLEFVDVQSFVTFCSHRGKVFHVWHINNGSQLVPTAKIDDCIAVLDGKKQLPKTAVI